jgi:PAS domain S-box-containing protein
MVNVPGAIYRSAWHAGHRIELISDEIERISGFPPEHFIASDRRTIISIVHPDDLDSVKQAVAESKDRRRSFVLEYRIVRADGSVRWVLDRGQLVSGAGGMLWMDGAIVDITDRRKVEQDARRREIEEARNEELRASRARVVEAADSARRKIERDLHDGAQQRLVALALNARVARSRIDAEPESAGPFLDNLLEELMAASTELRELARGIHPAVLTDRGLAPAVAALAARAAVPVEIVELPDDRAPTTAEAAAYFTVAEALTNVAKYARATQATIRIAKEDGALVVEVRDDGVGGARASAGSGLSGLADRVDAVDGSLRVISPPGEGTLIRAVLPIRSGPGPG